MAPKDLSLSVGWEAHTRDKIPGWFLDPCKNLLQKRRLGQTPKGAVLPALVLQDSSSRAASKEGSTSFTP